MPLRVVENNTGDVPPPPPGLQTNVRSMLLDMPTPSSLYSRSASGEQEADRRRSSGFSGFRELLSRGRWGESSSSSNNSSISHLPLTGSASQDDLTRRDPEEPISPLSPLSPQFSHREDPREPEPAVLSGRPVSQPPPFEASQEQLRDLEAQRPARERSSGSRRSRTRRRRRNGVWVRRRGAGPCLPFAHGTKRRTKISSVISGLFLAAVLTTYLTLALTIRGLGPEFHIPMIITIVGSTIFFVHSLIRLLFYYLGRSSDSSVSSIASRSSRSHRRHGSNSQGQRIRIPSVAGPEGFSPDVPIQVILAVDEEIMALGEDGHVEVEKLESLKAPPPAYGLWRCSVRANPSLLHWQRVDSSNASSPNLSDGATSPVSPVNILSARTPNFPATGTLGRVPEMAERSSNLMASPLRPINEVPPGQGGVGHRPPSYATDDGVDYLMNAQPRTFTVIRLPEELPREGDVHPALR